MPWRSASRTEKQRAGKARTLRTDDSETNLEIVPGEQSVVPHIWNGRIQEANGADTSGDQEGVPLGTAEVNTGILLHHSRRRGTDAFGRSTSGGKPFDATDDTEIPRRWTAPWESHAENVRPTYPSVTAKKSAQFRRLASWYARRRPRSWQNDLNDDLRKMCDRSSLPMVFNDADVWGFLEKPQGARPPLHSEKIGTVDLEAMRRMAKGTRHEKRVEQAIAFLTDASCYSTTCPPADIAPRCGMSREDLAKLVDDGLVATTDESHICGIGALHTVVEHSGTAKERRRIVADMLSENLLGREPEKVTHTTIRELQMQTWSCAWACSFDFKKWYTQFPLSTEVSRHFCFKTRDGWMHFLRAPMGHKAMCFVAQAFTALIADVQLEDETIDCISESYIDNVEIRSYAREHIERARTIFIRRCGEVNAQIGEMTNPTTCTTYRGMTTNFVTKRISLKG